MQGVRLYQSAGRPPCPPNLGIPRKLTVHCQNPMTAMRPPRDWTQGSVTRNLLTLSWPMMVTEGLYTLGISIDMIWVGRLGSGAIAGIGVAGIFAGFQMMIMTGFGVGTRAVVARFVGAGDVEGANHASQQAFVICVIYTVVMVALGLSLAEPLLTMMGFAPDVVAVGADYMRIMFGLGSVTVAFWYMGYSIIQASGDAITPMVIIILYRLLHVPLSYALVLGEWGLPQMGSSGAALANVISRGVGAALVLAALYGGWGIHLDWTPFRDAWRRGGPVAAALSLRRVVGFEPSRLRLTMRGFRVDLATVWRMVRIGLPASVMGVQRTLGMAIIAGLMAPFGTIAVAAHSLLQRVDMVLVPPAMGLGMASGVLAGQNLGAGQPLRAERSAWRATIVSSMLMVAAAVTVFLFAESIVGIFTKDAELIGWTSRFLRVSAVGYLALGPGTVLMQSLAGAGDTFAPMIIGVVTAWAIQLPLALLLPNIGDFGVFGIRWALVIGVIIQGVVALVYFRLGRWKRKRV